MSPTRDPLENRRKQAKELLRAVMAQDPGALERVRRHHPQFPHAGREIQLTDAQLVIAREHGFESWPKMKVAMEAQPVLAKSAPANEPTPEQVMLATVNKTQVGKMWRALREFGYSSLTFKQTEGAAKRVLRGEDVAGDVIAMFVKGFLEDAGIIKKK